MKTMRESPLAGQVPFAPSLGPSPFATLSLSYPGMFWGGLYSLFLPAGAQLPSLICKVCSPDVCLPWYGALPGKGSDEALFCLPTDFLLCYSYFDYTTHPLSLELWLCWDQSSEMEFLWGPQLLDPRLGLSKWCQWDCVGESQKCALRWYVEKLRNPKYSGDSENCVDRREV